MIICSKCKKDLGPIGNYGNDVNPLCANCLEIINKASKKLAQSRRPKKKEGFVTRISEGWKLFVGSVRILYRVPVLITPLFLSWIITASVVLFARYYIKLPGDVWTWIIVTYTLVSIIALSISCCNVVMLEMIQQIEKGEKIRVSGHFSTDFLNIFLKCSLLR